MALPAELRTCPAVAESAISRCEEIGVSMKRLPAEAVSERSRLLPGPWGRIGPVIFRFGAVNAIEPSDVEAPSTVRSAPEVNAMSPESVRLIATTW